jgi:hypothetical protein
MDLRKKATSDPMAGGRHNRTQSYDVAGIADAVELGGFPHLRPTLYFHRHGHSAVLPQVRIESPETFPTVISLPFPCDAFLSIGVQSTLPIPRRLRI